MYNNDILVCWMLFNFRGFSFFLGGDKLKLNFLSFIGCHLGGAGREGLGRLYSSGAKKYSISQEKKHYFFKKKIQFDQSDLLLPSSDYYKLGFGHPIMQTYYHMVVDVAVLLGAEPDRARDEMRKLIDFETELAGVRGLLLIYFLFLKMHLHLNSADHDPANDEEKLL